MDLVTSKPPEEIFPLQPLEVWGLILDQLTSPSDLINCTKVCKEWDKLLELKKTTFLMPQVFPVLYKYLNVLYRKSLQHHEQDNQHKNKEENPITTILKMRLVSQGWKEAVDSYLQNNHAVYEFSFEGLTLEDVGNDEPVPYLPYQFGVGGVTSECIAKLESFLGKGFSPHINPFITREVCYYEHVDNELDQRRLNTAFKNMLEAFGSHIWTCELISRTHTNRARFYKLVGSFLRLMPNLRSLQLRYYGSICNGRRRTNSEREELDMLLKNEPLPRLEHLTILEMMHVPYPLSVGLLETNGHLQNLAIHNGDFDDDVLLPDYIANVHIPNLKLLRFPWCEQNLCCVFHL
ncbi:unnamed protein product [Orchesella dallaii]|uniref:F-box domain-containing protein n=1 Tax=Orchesella dallaii TaxID=48710 RepID=A0ABP1RYK4_9HEXA